MRENAIAVAANAASPTAACQMTTATSGTRSASKKVQNAIQTMIIRKSPLLRQRPINTLTHVSVKVNAIPTSEFSTSMARSLSQKSLPKEVKVEKRTRRRCASNLRRSLLPVRKRVSASTVVVDVVVDVAPAVLKELKILPQVV